VGKLSPFGVDIANTIWCNFTQAAPLPRPATDDQGPEVIGNQESQRKGRAATYNNRRGTMMTLNNFPQSPKRQPVQVSGPHRRKISFNEFLLSAVAHIAIAGILAYAVLGMAGVWD
jgi:hypothetical protein